MHIAVLSDFEAGGGANIAARRLTEAFAAAGHRITRIYQAADCRDPRWDTRLIPSLLATHELPFVQKTAATMVPLAIRLRRHQRHAAQVLARTLSDIRPDVVNIHNLHIADWSPEMIRVSAQAAPVVCTLHDTWTLTGRCVYPGSCEKYIDGCDALCPTPDEYPALNASAIATAWANRREILRECANAVAVTPSTWLGEVATAGIWRPRQVFKIPYALDLKRFEPIARELAKSAMGITPHEPVILACASELASPRKGVRLMLDALAAGVGRHVHLFLLGMPLDVPPIPHATVHQLGFVNDDRLRALVFSCADVFVHPALADNAPLTVIESLACGTPVVAFPVDGLPETVIAGRTGWLTPGRSSELLRTTIAGALDDLDRGVNLRVRCRQFAEDRYDPSSVARQYESVFEHLVNGTSTSVPLIGMRPERPMSAPLIAAS
jgi:glycosyltransferase involved in cell wall biosynthesis